VPRGCTSRRPRLGTQAARFLADRLAIVRLCAHYFAHGAWLSDGELLRDAPRLAGIAGVAQ
jgi:proline iminopeptidase